jgi:hypothetical protein
VPYAVLLPPAASPTTEAVPDLAHAEPTAETDHDEQHGWTDTTITDIDGGLTLLGRWLIRSGSAFTSADDGKEKARQRNNVEGRGRVSTRNRGIEVTRPARRTSQAVSRS